MASADTDGAGKASSKGFDLARVRHEVRTPINHILGYCEMLMEEGPAPAQTLADLRRIHAAGKQLQQLITHYFSEEHFYRDRDVSALYHELRTPVNHVIGYSDLLLEQAEEAGLSGAIPDLQKIRQAAGNWLALMETYLVGPAPAAASPRAATADRQPLEPLRRPPAPEAERAEGRFADQGAILVVDDDEGSREMLARRLRRSGYTVSVASEGTQALAVAREQAFDLVLLDMIMPGFDGLQVLSEIKSDASLRDLPVIMLSALDEEARIARCIEIGAEDYLAKPFNPVFLRARIGACLEKKRLRDQERATHAALLKSQQQLAGELAQAAAYVRSLLPAPMTGTVGTEWCFKPSAQLGGDALGYHAVDADHLAIYLLDVCGHGVGAALLSVSVYNTLRAETLAGVDFRQPEEVLAGLNRVFPMERQHNLYFTAWYGVYRVSQRELRFASGGHPPALLLAPDGAGGWAPRGLQTRGPAVGCFPEAEYRAAAASVPPGSRLLVLSDGVFEIFQEGDRVGTWEEFAAEFRAAEVLRLSPEQRWQRALALRGGAALEDDFSLLELRFA